MRGARAVVVLGWVALLAAVATPGAEAAGPLAVAGPGAQFYTYATPVLVVQPGGELTLLNGDAVLHDLVGCTSESDCAGMTAVGPDDNSWCGPSDPSRPEGPGNPRQFPIGQCPLFWSPLIGLAQTTPVSGLDGLEQGRTYMFLCSIHPTMKGILVSPPEPDMA